MSFIRIEDGNMSSPIAKFLNEKELESIKKVFDTKENDLLLIVADEDNIVFNTLGALRGKLARELDLIDENDFKMLWVVDFPMFEYDEQEQRYIAMHHPFTHPKIESVEELSDENLTNLKARAYDLVINGYEVFGGSIRIHQSDIQRRIFELLKLSDEDIKNKFGFFIEALKYGTPIHGGIACGLDRLIMILTDTENIRDVIAFPKTQSGADLLMDAPTEVTKEQLEELGIGLDE